MSSKLQRRSAPPPRSKRSRLADSDEEEELEEEAPKASKVKKVPVITKSASDDAEDFVYKPSASMTLALV